MVVFETIKEIQDWGHHQKSAGLKVGFVPTMGALHPGHISLIRLAKEHCQKVVSSIFVNPTQFNNQSDLANYPKTLEEDLRRLTDSGCDAVFTPSVLEMYPQAHKGHWDFGPITNHLEGAFRPGHFDGVLTIIQKLFEAVDPDVAFFGEKDFQQLAVIRAWTRLERPQVHIVGGSTVREEDGLAMSSRNMRLSFEQRSIAKALSQVLFWIKEQTPKMQPQEIKIEAAKKLANTPGIDLEYLEIIDSETFVPILNWKDTASPRAMLAAYVGQIRLIDNLLLV